MSLRFLSDQCVPAEITNHMRQRDYSVSLLREVLPIRSPDELVIAKAQELGAILLSLNGDFAAIVAYPPASYKGIVAIQPHNHPEIIPRLLERLTAFFQGNPAESFYHGKLFVVEVHRIRLRGSEQRFSACSQRFFAAKKKHITT